MRTYQIGNEVAFHTAFALDGTPTNPINVTLTLRDPCGATYAPAITNPSTGLFAANFTPQIAGVWHYRWQGTGNFDAAHEDTFEISSSDFGG